MVTALQRGHGDSGAARRLAGLGLPFPGFEGAQLLHGGNVLHQLDKAAGWVFLQASGGRLAGSVLRARLAWSWTRTESSQGWAFQDSCTWWVPLGFLRAPSRLLMVSLCAEQQAGGGLCCEPTLTWGR